MLEDMTNSGMDVPAHALEAAQEMLLEAEATSRRSLFEFKSYWGGWVNSCDSTQASTFEMVLSFVLLHHYFASEDDVDLIMSKREGAEPTAEGGQGQGGRRGGIGKGKGSGGKGKGGRGKGNRGGAGRGSGGKPGRQSYVYKPWHRMVAR